MGIGTSCVVKRFCKHQMKILMLGLDASGTTTILYKLKLGQIVCTIPTIGFNVETVEFNNLRFSVWDLGGQDKGLIFVVDSSDKERIIEARNQLHQILCEDALCNAAEVANKLGLHLIRQHRWYIQDASALSGRGLYQGLQWLSQSL